jgi:hypothetical protein
MNRARINLDDFDGPPSKDPALLRQISEDAGFPSRQAVPLPAPTVVASAAARADSVGFQRPARQAGNRHIAMNIRVDQTTAERIYALRDADPARKQSLADVIDAAIELLHARQFPNADQG